MHLILVIVIQRQKVINRQISLAVLFEDTLQFALVGKSQHRKDWPSCSCILVLSRVQLNEICLNEVMAKGWVGL